MFYLTYVRQELRRRLGRTIFTVLGLAVGVALVVAVTALGAGLDKAQRKVLGPLSGVATDLTVTKQSVFPGEGRILALGGGLDTDLSKLGKPGEKFKTDSFFSMQPSFTSDEPAKVAATDGVETTSSALLLRGIHQEGTIPKISATVETGGETVEQRQTPMTPEEREKFEECIRSKGGGEGRGEGRQAFADCLPERLRDGIIAFRVPRRDVTTDVDTPQTDINSAAFTIAGIKPDADINLISTEQVTSGRFLQNAGEAMVSQSYASEHKLEVGSTLTLKNKDFSVVGIVAPPLGGNAADIYVPLTDLQTLSDRKDETNVVLARASSASKVDNVSNAIERNVDGTNISDASDLANQVAGSLVDSGNLIKRLGFVLAIVGIVAAVLIAILLTLSSVAKRTRELGTLKAIGWSPRLVVRQILAEAGAQGILGALIGVGLGIGAAAVLGVLSPTLTARSVAAAPPGPGRVFGLGRLAQQASETVHLTAPVKPTMLVVAAVLAILGGLVAGLVGAMRAARLRPADAMREVS